MTREKAIQMLNVHLVHWKHLKNDVCTEPNEAKGTIEALQMAIEALQKKGLATIKCNADTIKKLRDMVADVNCEEIFAHDDVTMPMWTSAWRERMFELIGELQTEPCEDAISRRAALDTFGLSEKTRKYGGDHSGYDTIMLYEVQDAIEALPSVQPKTGHWIYELEDWNKWTCSECGWSKRTDVHVKLGYNFCPDCGAKMEVE